MNLAPVSCYRPNRYEKAIQDEKVEVVCPDSKNSCFKPLEPSDYTPSLYHHNKEEISVYDITIQAYNVVAKSAKSLWWFIGKVAVGTVSIVRRVSSNISTAVKNTYKVCKEVPTLKRWAELHFIQEITPVDDKFSPVDFDKLFLYEKKLNERAKLQTTVDTLLSKGRQRVLLSLCSFVLRKKVLYHPKTAMEVFPDAKKYEKFPLHPLHGVKSVAEYKKIREEMENYEKKSVVLSLEEALSRRINQEKEILSPYRNTVSVK